VNPKGKFPIPEGVVEIEDDYQLNLAHYELLHLKPKGTILFAGEPKEIAFQFFAGENREDGILARPAVHNSPNAKRIFDHLERYPRLECFITITLLQFRFIFIATQALVVYGNGQRTLRLNFPKKILKTHRRKFIRIPFNENFPAELRFHTEGGQLVRKLADLSREGMRLQLKEGDDKFIVPGARLKQAVLKVLNREMPVGLTVITVHGGTSAGIRILAISEEDKIWIRDCIRVLMKQILNLKDPKFDDQIERDEVPNKKA
jgi:hypothetical protein